MANGVSWLDILCCLCLVNALSPRRREPRERIVYVQQVPATPVPVRVGAKDGELPMISCATMVRSTDPQAI
jgi:hypothetical protein